MKKGAFSYLELIIAMTLVVIVAILTAPLMTSMGKKSSPMYGEYKCYARFVNGSWKLFQNERVNVDAYPADDTEIEDGAHCLFTRPAGNISSYTVILYGGGGSGSMPYFVTAKSDGINLALGQEGKAGEKKSVVDSLEKAFDIDGTMSIYLCDENSDKNCLGKGGEVNQSKSSRAPKERIEKIRTNLQRGGDLSGSDEDYIRNSGCTGAITAMNYYKVNPDDLSRKNYLISQLNDGCYNSISDSSKYTGNSGQAAKVMLSSGKQALAQGGSYGISDKFSNSNDYSISSFTNAGNGFYYMPVTASPLISDNKFKNCNGDDANNPNDVDIFENFGAGGGAGVFACKIKNEDNLNILNTKDNHGNYLYVNYAKTTNNVSSSVDNQCFAGYGGAGAGGAIVIQWN